jgi:TctA family transporter
MLDALLQGFGAFAQPLSILFLLIGVFIGSLVGLVPGLNGVSALALMIPFVYGMDPGVGLSFLLAMHAVVNTAGSITAILLGIPGEPACTATVIDGFPMAQQGRGGEAIGAALTASGVGGLFGALVLLLLLPVLSPIVLLFQSPDTLMIALFGISLIAVLSRANMAKGLFAGALGTLFATFGYQGVTGVPRFWFGIDQLLEGFQLVPVTLGLFAIPEIISLGVSGRTIAAQGTPPVGLAQVLRGCRLAFANGWMTLRSSVIGLVIGIIPGLGSATAPWIAYASAAQTSKNKDQFGRGAVEGVIAPEASNNSKESGAMIPTLAFGIPGSSAMALLIGAFFLFGLTPGPEFLKTNMAIAVQLTTTIAVANVVAAVLVIFVGARLAAVTRVPGRLMAPVLIVTLLIGTYATSGHIMDVVTLLLFGILGLAMKELNYSRPCFLVGFVLTPMVETYLHISLRAHGPAFLLRPIPIAIMLILAVLIGRTIWFNRTARI